MDVPNSYTTRAPDPNPANQTSEVDPFAGMPIDTELFMEILSMQLDSLDTATHNALDVVQRRSAERDDLGRIQSELQFMRAHTFHGSPGHDDGVLDLTMTVDTDTADNLSAARNAGFDIEAARAHAA